MKLTLFCALVLASCTKPNPAVCCLDQADCNEVGLDEVRSCSAGLACVDHQCEVPSCSMTGCMASAPVCNIATDVCDPCTDSSQCSKFADSPICDTSSGGCVGCVGPSDCSGATPVCDAQTCRACQLDSDCDSGACGDDGACVAEDKIVYMASDGVDNGTCTRSSPCRTFGFALPQTSATRTHVVIAAGAYLESSIQVDAQATDARPLYIHGGGASFAFGGSSEGTVMTIAVPTILRHLEVSAPGGDGLHFNGTLGPIVAEDIKVHQGYRAAFVTGTVSLRDFMFEGTYYGIESSQGQIEIDRGVIHDVSYGISTAGLVDIKNLLVYKASERAIEMPVGSGSIAFSTFANSGTDTGTGPRAVSCSSEMTIRSSIVWAPGTSSRVAVQGCNLASTIAGPTPVSGAMNVDPMFIDGNANDYHIQPTSPAKDALDAGPELDFERDSRPRGTRFDIGADEAP